jgi:hypothetical protein
LVHEAGGAELAAETFTLTYRSEQSGSAACQAANWRSDSPSTQAPMPTIAPFSSARSTKWYGPSNPRSGCCQRTSDSTPTTARVRTSTIGWYCSTNCRASIASSSAVRSSSRCTMAVCKSLR